MKRINEKWTMIGAHCASWKIHNGEIQDDLWVLHSCDNKICVNPNHLFLGTSQDNQNDSIDKDLHWSSNITHCSNGHERTIQNNIFLMRADGREYRKCLDCYRILYPNSPKLAIAYDSLKL